MDVRSPIEQHDDLLGGTAVFAGTRVPIQTLLDYLAAGDRLSDFLRDFPSVNEEDARRVLEMAKEALLTHPGARAS